jgi:predicted dehydrogenase
VNPLRVGVIGVGYLGQHHARLYAANPNVHLVGLVESDAARAEEMADRHGTKAFHTVESLLPHVDAVSIAVPTSWHFAVARTCLEAGVHVLVEKPITVEVAEAQALVEMARASGLTLQVGHIERFNPIVLACRAEMACPRLIEASRLAPFVPRGADVDVVLDLMIHDLDLMLSLNPGSVEQVWASGLSLLSPTHDVVQARIVFSSGCVAHATASRVSDEKQRRWRLYGPDRSLSLDLQSRQGHLARRQVAGTGLAELLTTTFSGSNDEPLRLELDSFVDAVRGGHPPVVSGAGGLAALQLAHQVLAAIR